MQKFSSWKPTNPKNSVPCPFLNCLANYKIIKKKILLQIRLKKD